MMTRGLPLLIAAGLLALVAIGCKTDEGSNGTASTGPGASNPAAPKSDKKPLKLAFVTNGTSDFWSIARAGIKKATDEDPSLHVDFRELPNGSPAEQQQALDDLTVAGTQGIAISVKDPPNQIQMINNAAKKTMIFTQDSDAAGANRTCYVGTDNFAAGKQAGEEIKKACPQGGKIMFFVGSKDAENAKDRIGGAEEALKGSNITVLDVRTDDGDRARAKANVADAIVAHPDLVCLVGIWSINGPAIHNALKDAGKLG
ncbi:MAG TPA: substrate-binding domain-containing protein, partial [Fimbriimonadaceae bacterium]|nr:substrate-binding domain-containing protein [Fimbriimonadaceae bacterium]